MVDDKYLEYLDEDGDLNVSALSSGLSVFIWGLVMAKAKSGILAATSKDHKIVQSSYKKTLLLGAMVGVAYLAKYNSDTNYLQNKIKPLDNSVNLFKSESES